MRKLFTIVALLFCLVISTKTPAQGIYQYWGTAYNGGDEYQGALYTFRYTGGGYKMRPGPEVSVKGCNPQYQQPVLYNNKLYAVLAGGGLNGEGILMSYDPATGMQVKLADMYTIGGDRPVGSLVLYNNKLYGTCSDGGTGGEGLLFEYNLVTNGFVKKIDFNITNGANPVGQMVVYNNKLYGVTAWGGANEDGVIYEYDPATNIFTVKKDLLQITGRFPEAGLAEHNGLLYGVCKEGGAAEKGVLFEFNPANNNYLVRTVFSGNNGENPYAALTLYNNKFYGQTSAAGTNGGGTLFEFDPVSKAFATRYQHTDAGGTASRGPLTVYNNKLYGLLVAGGTGSDGTLFEFDPAGFVFAKKVDLGGSFGSYPNGGMTLYNNRLYGFTAEGGSNNTLNESGVLFEYNPVANGYQVKLNFRANTGINPMGGVVYYNGKTYGILKEGGNNNRGGIWSYDMATHTYSTVFHFTATTGYTTVSEAMIVYNNKLYGTLHYGGPDGDGSIFEFDPATNTFTTIHDFDPLTGDHPCGRLAVRNNKFYGTCSGGGTGGGCIYEFDPANNNYTVHVGLNTITGRFTRCGLTEFNDKFYGTSYSGGTNDQGTLFQWDPVTNNFIVLHNFSMPTGCYSNTGVTIANNKIYGVVEDGGPNFIGGIFEYDPGTATYTLLHSFLIGQGEISRCGIAFNEEEQKFYGIGSPGANFFTGGEGHLYEFDPATLDYTRQHTFVAATGLRPSNQRPEKVPAMVAPGTPGGCVNGGSANVTASNANEWIPFVNSNGDAVAEINPNGNILGRVNVEFYVHDGPTRSDGVGNLYLDRNITITPDNQPASPVSVRLYIRKTEFDKLKATPGSMVNVPGDLAVFKGNDVCQAVIGAAAKITSGSGTWGADYVYTTSVTTFSTFYFASRLLTTLPVHIISFRGVAEPAANKLEWKATCNNDINFVIERSPDGVNYQPIGNVQAGANDCNTLMTYSDINPPAKAYYRLQLNETGAPIKYSSIILLNRNGTEAFDVKVVPNPVLDGQAIIQVRSDKKAVILVRVSDVMGRIVIEKTINAEAGATAVRIDVSALSKGIYNLTYTNGEKTATARFLKQ